LRDNIEVRDHFRRRFSHILVDEAQDTDPIQAEIAMFIAEGVAAGDAPAESRPVSWEQVTPQLGKLFVVGDPKQSIYRFRRADVRQIVKLQQVMGGNTVHLVQNFRSQRPVLEWVNHVYEQWMGEGSSDQATYVPIAHRWEANVDHPGSPKVYSLGEEMDGGINAVRGEEAGSIAGLLHTIVGQRWQVLDADRTAQAGGDERYRDAGYSDICILIRTRTGLRTLEIALEDAGVPYRLEGSSLIFATQEVMDLLNCLKAIDDPADQVATVAALRSPAFACTDVELLQFSEAGGKFDYISEDSPAAGPVAESLSLIRDFHQLRLWMSLPELIDRFIRARLLMESAIDHPRTREQWRRYRFIVEQARSFVETGGNSLRAFLEWIERQAEEGARVTETPVPEGDEEAVRIMTIHAAKGLEFPVVVLTALNTQRSNRREVVLFDRDTHTVEISVGPEGRRFETPGYEALATRESELGDDEQVRLLYVAATRARDHLVISLHRSAKGRKTDADKIAEILDGVDNLWEPAPLVGGAAPQHQDPSPNGATLKGHSLVDREEWLNRRTETIQQQSRPVSVSATKLAQVSKEEPDTDEPWRRGRGGTSVGRAVHSVLQTIDLSTGDGIDETSQAQAAAEGIPQRSAEVARLARVAVDSEVVRRAVASSRFWREVPVAAPMTNGVLQGFIDLLFEEDGNLIVVDYKTDAVDSDHVDDAAARYGPQGGAYALAVEKATGRPVTEVVFLFLHANRSAALPDLPGLAARAESAAEDHLNNAEVR
jgi:ATP-dependent exoDNAse (exonuclease V) beta subunit